MPRLAAPRLNSGDVVTGSTKEKLRLENKRRRIEQQERQQRRPYWTVQRGDFRVPDAKEPVANARGGMCPTGMALHHPAAGLLRQYATAGCPPRTGRD